MSTKSVATSFQSRVTAAVVMLRCTIRIIAFRRRLFSFVGLVTSKFTALRGQAIFIPSKS